MKPKEQKAFNTQTVKAALQKRYPYPGWALLEEVRDAAGYDATRSADALAMSLWKSRGLELHGFEIKVSRSDWLREKGSPEKAESISRYCDRWWLVVSDESIVKDGEVPPAWGLLVLHRASGRIHLKTVKEAPQNPAVTPMSRTFLATILKRSMDDRLERVHPSSLAQYVEEAAKKLAANKDEEIERRKEDEVRLHTITSALGISKQDIDNNLPDILEAFNIITGKATATQWRQRMEAAVRETKRANRLATKALTALEKIEKEEKNV